MLSDVIWFYYTLLLCCRNGRWNNVNIMMTLTDLKYCFPGRLTITEFVLLSLVMLEDLGMLDTYGAEIVNKILKKITQEQLKKYNAPTPTDIYFSPPKHLQLISAQYKSYRNIFFTATAMQNCHFLMDYWTISNVMVKFPPTGRQMFYLVLNYMGEYIHLLIKPLLNAMGFSCLEVNVQLSKKGAVIANHLKSP